MITLGLETSCDETAIAIVKQTTTQRQVLSNVIHSQIKLHQPYQGVVPQLAARAHLDNLIPVLEQALKKANTNLTEIDNIAITSKPGLKPALLTGLMTAQTLAWALKKPLLKINHLEAHLYSALNPEQTDYPTKTLGLIVSGGHTLLLKIEKLGDYQLLGQTLDDAAGECFDKCARLLGLPYPGGPAISKLALEGKAGSFKFPRPMINQKSLNFSFSGLKTAVLYQLKKMSAPEIKKQQANLAASIQAAIVDSLVAKTKQAIKQYPTENLIIVGGVAANKSLQQTFKNKFPNLKILTAPPDQQGDNGAMIANLALIYQQQQRPVSDNFI